MSFLAKVIPQFCWIILYLQYSFSILNEGGSELQCMTGVAFIIVIIIVIIIIVIIIVIVYIAIIIIFMYWGSSWGNREVFQPKMPYYAKMGACPMKNSAMTLAFMWNLESLCIHNFPYTISLVGHSQGLVHSTCLTWDFLNAYHMFFHQAIRVCTAQATN